MKSKYPEYSVFLEAAPLSTSQYFQIKIGKGGVFFKPSIIKIFNRGTEESHCSFVYALISKINSKVHREAYI